jgi:hypothetical protein
MAYEEAAPRQDSLSYVSKEPMIPEHFLNEMNKQGLPYELGSQISQGVQP